MVISVPSEAPAFERGQFIAQRAPLPTTLSTTTIEQESNESVKKERLRPDVPINTRSWFFMDRQLELAYHKKIEPIELFPNRPWLPLNALKLLDKLKRGPITEKELVRLMDTVAKRSSEHFELDEGKFVAMTFHGRVVEVSDTRVNLLKKIQRQTYREQIFVWRVGYKAFSGRI